MELNDASDPFYKAASKEPSPPKKIDWAGCPSVTIDADHPENLPDNIRVFRAKKLDHKALRHALKLMKPPVQVVQIEIEEAETARKQLRAYVAVLPGAEWVSAGNHNSFVATKTITESLTMRFTGEVNAPYLRSLRECESEAIEMITSPTIAARKIFPGSYIFSMLLGKLNPQAPDAADFHEHKERMGYYILLSEGKEGLAKGTFFLDSNDLVVIDHKGKSVHYYTTDKPTIYEGKPGAYQIFTAGNHPQGAAFHSTPFGPRVDRVTCLTKVFPQNIPG